MDQPFLSIAVINYNGEGYIKICLDSLRNLDYKNKEIILVDNNSKDSSPEIIKNQYPEVRIISCRSNLGFAKAANLAIQASKGEYVAVLNNDIEVDRDWASQIMHQFILHKDVAACSPKILMYDDRKVICNAGGGMDILGYGYDRGRYENDNSQYDLISEQLFATAAAAIIRKELFKEIGYFDEKFFMYHEDVDWGWRAHLSGYRILYVPASIAYHKLSCSTRKYLHKDAIAYLGDRHRIRSLLKNYQRRMLIKISKRIFKRMVQDIIKHPRFLLNILWNIVYLADTLKERRKVQSKRRLSDEALLRLITDN